MTRVGRKPKPDAIRDSAGISRDYEKRERDDYEATLARRGLELIGHGLDASQAREGPAGFTLGKLRMRRRADRNDPSGISQEQYNAGDRFARICRRHQAIMGYAMLRSPGFNMVSGGGERPELDDEAEVRAEFRLCYNVLANEAKKCRDAHKIVYGICVENWSLGGLDRSYFGVLREALNSLGKALRDLDKRRSL